MKIAIIGSGNVGKALSGSFVRAGHNPTISSRHRENAESAAAATGATAAATNADAVRDADVVVLAVPYDTLLAVVDDLGDELNGKVVVDATNPLRADYQALAIEVEGTSAAEQVQARAGGAKVVKAFNSALAARQAEPSVDGTPIDGFVAGDDEQAKATVLELVRSIGFRPIDAGPLGAARALEALALLNITLQLRNGWTWQTGWRLVGPTSA